MVFQTCHTSRYVLPPSTCHISQLNRCNHQKCLHLKLAENVCLFVTPKSPCRIKIFGSRSQLLTTNGLILYPTKKCFDQIMMFFYEDWGWKIRVWWKTKVEIELTNGPKNNNCFESKVNSMLVLLLEWKELFTASSVSRDKPIILTCPFQCTSCPISWKWPVCKSFARHDGRVRPCHWDISTYIRAWKVTWKPRTTMKAAIFSKQDLK